MSRFRGFHADLGYALMHQHDAALPELLGSGFVGEMVCLPTHVREAHAHDLIEVGVAVAGRGERVCGVERATVDAGDAWLIAPGAWHGARADREDPYHYFSLCFDAARFGLRLGDRDRVAIGDDGAMSLELRVAGQRVLRGCAQAIDPLRRLLAALDRHELERRGPLLTEALARALVVEVLVALAAAALAKRATAEPPRATDIRREFRDLIAWLPSRLADPPALAEMARRAGLSPAHFAHAFKHETGRTPLEFVTELRVEEAAQRLRAEPRKPVATISAELGFGSASYFAAAFRRTKGCSPGEWRAIATRAS